MNVRKRILGSTNAYTWPSAPEQPIVHLVAFWVTTNTWICPDYFFFHEYGPCGHVAQVIIEGREIQSDGGEKDKDNPTTNQTKPTTAHRPRLHQAVFPLYLGETSETMTANYLWA